MPSFWSKIVSFFQGAPPPALEAAPETRPPSVPLASSAPLLLAAPQLHTALDTLETFFQDRVIPRMIAELKSPSVDVRRSAISVLRHAGMAGVHAIPALLEVVERPGDPKDILAEYARKEAAYAIEELRQVYKQYQQQQHQKQQESEAALRREEEAERRDEEAQARAMMAEVPTPPRSALGDTRDELDENLAALLQLLSDPVAGVRVSVIQTLVKLDAAHPTVLSSLRGALRDDDPRVRQEAALAIGQLVR